MNQPVEAPAGDTVELHIPARAEWVALARLAVSAIANRLKLTIEEIEDVKLAVAEACTSIIQQDAHGETLALTFETMPGALRVHVRDTGSHDLRAGAASAMDYDEARVVGLGVFLIRTLMDEVSYDQHPERGTDLVMVKRIVR